MVKKVIVQFIAGMNMGKIDEGEKLYGFTPMSNNDFLEKYKDTMNDTELPCSENWYVAKEDPFKEKVEEEISFENRVPSVVFVQEVEEQEEGNKLHFPNDFLWEDMIWRALRLASLGFIEVREIYLYDGKKWSYQTDSSEISNYPFRETPGVNFIWPDVDHAFLVQVKRYTKQMIDFVEANDWHFSWSRLDQCFIRTDDDKRWLEKIHEFWRYLVDYGDHKEMNSIKWRLRTILNGNLPAELVSIFELMEYRSLLSEGKPSILRRKEYRFIPEKYRMEYFIHKRLLFYTQELVMCMIPKLIEYDSPVNGFFNLFFRKQHPEIVERERAQMSEHMRRKLGL